MNFRVLGPLSVVAPTQAEAQPRGPKQRNLLGLLLLNSPRAASTDRLADALWPDELPADPGGALRTQVSRLRAFLQESGCGDALQHDAAGYRLVLPVDAVDSWQVAQLERQARESASTDDALQLLDSALALVRGEPYEDLADDPGFVPEIARLNELLSAVRERRAELLLDMGRTREALAAAEPLIQSDPLRERPRAVWMRALFQEGRRHEALAAFQDYRRLLSSELGLDPSPALRELETEIIQHSAAPSMQASAPPAPLTRLIGRGQEIGSINRLLESTRLLTLTGPGGSGKTRLAVEVARNLDPGEGLAEGEVRNLIWVGLESTSDAGLLTQEVSAAFGVRELPGRSPDQALRQAVATRPALLILDNCEHLIEACAALVSELLQAGPELAVLATSREPLGLPGETTWPVPPLNIPGEELVSIEDLAQCHAVELFVERAAAALPGFVVSPTNAGAVTKICRQLDGIPLALELAAARVRILSPAEIAARLETDFELLSSSRSTLPRHQTLRATLDWSYHLLDDSERTLLQRLSVFAGGFHLQAVEAICSGDSHEGMQGHERIDVLTGISALVEKSLVVVERRGDETRYRLLETVRAYSREHLPAAAAEDLRERHAEFYSKLAETAEPDLVSPKRAEVCRRLALDLENFRAVLEWSLALEPTRQRRALHAGRIAGSLWRLWHYLGRFAEARRWAQCVITAIEPASADALKARVHYTAAMACWLLGEPMVAVAHGEASSLVARRLGDPRLLIRSLSAHAFALRDVGEIQAAKALAIECVTVAREAEFPPAEMGFALWIHCTALLNAGDLESAEISAQEALELWRSTGDRWGLSMVLHGMAMARLGLDDLDRAAAYFREAIEVLRHDGEPYFVSRSLEGLAIVLVHQGLADAASRLFGAAEAIRETLGAPLLAFEKERHRRTLEVLVPLLAEERREEAWSEGRALSLEAAIAHALSA